MSQLTVQNRCYRHTTMCVHHLLAMLAVTTHNEEMSKQLYNSTTKAHRPDGQFLAPTCTTANTIIIFVHVYLDPNFKGTAKVYNTHQWWAIRYQSTCIVDTTRSIPRIDAKYWNRSIKPHQWNDVIMESPPTFVMNNLIVKASHSNGGKRMELVSITWWC